MHPFHVLLALFAVLTLAPVFWFGAHWLVGRFGQPPLSSADSALIAGSPLALGLVMSAVAHTLQPIAWSMLRSLGMA